MAPVRHGFAAPVEVISGRSEYKAPTLPLQQLDPELLLQRQDLLGDGRPRDKKRFYGAHAFYSLSDFSQQLAVHNRRSNNLPMRPLNRASPLEFAAQYV